MTGLQRLKALAVNGALMIISLAVTYGILEIAYRIYHYKQLERLPPQSGPITGLSEQIYRFHPQKGFEYHPDLEVRLKLFGWNNAVLQESVFHVNAQGHISPVDDPIEKPLSEFRIAVLGDSFTACLHSNQTWAFTLERLLNASPDLKNSIKKATFKVINFGLGATGAVQWDAIDRFEVVRYAPDCVIVNFIEDDLSRNFQYRRAFLFSPSHPEFSLTLSGPSPGLSFEDRETRVTSAIAAPLATLSDSTRFSEVKRAVYRMGLSRLPWFGWYPELLARAMGPRGQWLGLHQRLILGDINRPGFNSEEEAISESLKALTAIQSRHGHLVVLYTPMLPEILDRSTSNSRFVSFRRVAEKKNIGITSMLPYIPVPSNEKLVRQWFIPGDGHFTDDGVKMYAGAVYTHLAEHLKAVH